MKDSAQSLFNPTWIIQRKRDGKELSREEIRQFILGISTEEVADYQLSAFLMAVYFRGLSLTETLYLTEAMLDSGDRYDLSQIHGFKVDKHSTGGVGDKVSLILAPLAAACGLTVPMMAGRGLGHSGGTLDKLESIDGFDVHLSREKFEKILSSVGCVLSGQTERIVPADKKLYALRDVTGTVECVSLIVPSILSKKLAEGTQALVLDIKVGSGAFMKTKTQAQKLAKVFLQVSRRMKLPCKVILSDMNQPLGYAVGNRIEVLETIEVLKNEKTADHCSSDLRELTLHLCAQMLVLGKLARNLMEGRKLALDRLKDGSAWEVFQKMVRAQAGDPNVLLSSARLPLAPQKTLWKVKKKGFLVKINTETIGKILVELGGGRKKASDRIDPGVGLAFHKKLGQELKTGEPMVTVYSQKDADLVLLENLFWESVQISNLRKPVPKLILGQY